MFGESLCSRFWISPINPEDFCEQAQAWKLTRLFLVIFLNTSIFSHVKTCFFKKTVYYFPVFGNFLIGENYEKQENHKDGNDEFL